MEKIIIEQKNIGKRIDKFLAEEFFLYSRGEINKKIKKGDVLVNGKTIKPSYALEYGDEIMLENFSKEKEEGIFSNNDIPLDVIFENEDIIVINKPAGIQVHPSHNERKKTLVNGLVARFPEIMDVHDGSVDADLRPGIVHRLDKDTSGVMVIARNMKSFDALKESFKERHVEKKYVAIASGIFSEKEGVIEKPIARSTSYRKQVIARNNTKTTIRSAMTSYKVRSEHGEYSVVDVFPKTGRMHQIRIHLASVGHPVVGDMVYGDKKSITGKNGASRQLLHAESISFTLFGEKYEFLAPLPKDFLDFLNDINVDLSYDKYKKPEIAK